jgi:Peptidase family S41
MTTPRSPTPGILAGLCLLSSCQTQDVEPAPRLSSPELLEETISRVERNYAGYRLEVESNPARKTKYRAFATELRRRAKQASDDECLGLLRRYVGWFQDGHLFVSEYPAFRDAEIAEFRRTTPRRETAGLIDRLNKNRDTLAPIEGVWFTPLHEIAVSRDTNAKGTFHAVILETRSPHWRVGEVIAEFVETDKNRFAATLRMDDHSPRSYEADVHGLFLHMPPHTWGRRFPLAAHEKDILDAVDPRAPHFRILDAGACVISLPSLSGRYRRTIQDLCAEHVDEITSRDLLIVDLRGNGGGSSTAARPLAPFYHGDERKPPRGPKSRPHVLASPDTTAYYANMKAGFFTPAWLRSLRRRLKESPGELIPLYEGAGTYKEYSPRRRYKKPAHVAILIDGDVVSAGEGFLLEARRHTKVRVFGTPTGGMIDYQNVIIVGIGRGRHTVGLGYPVIASSDALPEGGFNKKGIPPEVRIDATVVDALQFVRDAYR